MLGGSAIGEGTAHAKVLGQDHAWLVEEQGGGGVCGWSRVSEGGG